jgi:hypothetical protein
MKNYWNFRFLVFALPMLFLFEKVSSCSMYKITINGKTIVGTNFDAYYLTPTIWFENAINSNTYGAGFSGGRQDGTNGIAPQSGMNVEGLSFSRLSSPTPTTGAHVSKNKKPITNPTLYLKDILHHCKNVDEVKEYIGQYDFSYFLQDVFIYIDRSGKFLVVEPYTMTIGSDSKYVLSNFCPSVTTEKYANNLERYHNGVAFLKHKIDTTLAFTTALSDTMHVCRKKVGDGTLLSSIWNLNEGIVTMYFYHDFKHPVQFNLKAELKKGDHILDIIKLFPPNTEFEKLVNYKIPQNNPSIMWYFMLCFGLFTFTGFYFLISYARKKKTANFSNQKLLLCLLCSVMVYYLIVLATNMYIFYFPSPYKDYEFSHLNIAAYIPFLTILILIPLVITNWKLLKEKTWSLFSKLLFTLNNIAFIILIVLFCYWGLYNVLN